MTTYSTTFPATETRISEGGNWLNGAYDGRDWHNVRTNGSIAYPATDDSGGYTDSTALLVGTWGADQVCQGTIYNAGPGGSGAEIEIRLRSTLSTGVNSGYEVYISMLSSQPYVKLARWNGALNNWTDYPGVGNNTSWAQNGQVFKAQIVGTVITAWLAGVQLFQYNTAGDAVKFSTGKPGIGFWTNTVTLVNMGFSDFAANDGLGIPPTGTPVLSVR